MPPKIQYPDNNGDVVNDDLSRGQTLIRTFGKDSSGVVGATKDERDSRITNKADLSHSISGNSVPKAGR